MNTDLNVEISSFFLTDARDYLNRYSLLSETNSHIGTRSKLLVDLLFSVECSLKALVFIESSEGEQRTYKKIKCHDFNKLISKLKESTQNICNEILSDELNDYYVSIRYSLESHVKFRNNQGALSDEYYSTIANHTWISGVFSQAQKLIEYTNSLSPNPIKAMNMNDMDIPKILDRHNRIRNLTQ